MKLFTVPMLPAVDQLHRWPDKIGEKIDPFAEDAPVTISRQQRRAMQRKQQKLEAA